MWHRALWDAEALSNSHPSQEQFPWTQNKIWTLALVECRFPKQKAGEAVKYKGAGKQIHLQIHLQTPNTDLITHRIRQSSFGEKGQHPGKTNSAGFAKLLFCYIQLNCWVLLQLTFLSHLFLIKPLIATFSWILLLCPWKHHLCSEFTSYCSYPEEKAVLWTYPTPPLSALIRGTDCRVWTEHNPFYLLLSLHVTLSKDISWPYPNLPGSDIPSVRTLTAILNHRKPWKSRDFIWQKSQVHWS